MSVLKVIYSCPVQGGRAANHAVDLVALLEEELGEVRPILPGDAGN
jgi:hypothetical protein